MGTFIWNPDNYFRLANTSPASPWMVNIKPQVPGVFPIHNPSQLRRPILNKLRVGVGCGGGVDCSLGAAAIMT